MVDFEEMKKLAAEMLRGSGSDRYELATAFLALGEMVPLLDELFFNTDGDPDFSKFMNAEQKWRALRGRDE